MKVTTIREVIDAAPRRWAQQYLRDGKWYDNEKRLIGEKLQALPPGSSAAEVDAIIGNDSWTSLRCDDCRTEVNALVMVGQEPDYESRTAELCRPCAHRALALIDEVLP